MWESMKGFWGGSQKILIDTLQAAARSSSAPNVPSTEEFDEAQESLNEARAQIASLRKKVAERDAIIELLRKEHLTMESALKLEVQQSEVGLGELSSRISSLELVCQVPQSKPLNR